jgi:hypothetical protein
MWTDLPFEIRALVLSFVSRDRRAAVSIQAAWRRYRTYVLVKRYAMLWRVLEFRRWNRDIRSFLARSRL